MIIASLVYACRIEQWMSTNATVRRLTSTIFGIRRSCNARDRTEGGRLASSIVCHGDRGRSGAYELGVSHCLADSDLALKCVVLNSTPPLIFLLYASSTAGMFASVELIKYHCVPIETIC